MIIRYPWLVTMSIFLFPKCQTILWHLKQFQRTSMRMPSSTSKQSYDYIVLNIFSYIMISLSRIFESKMPVEPWRLRCSSPCCPCMKRRMGPKQTQISRFAIGIHDYRSHYWLLSFRSWRHVNRLLSQLYRKCHYVQRPLRTVFDLGNLDVEEEAVRVRPLPHLVNVIDDGRSRPLRSSRRFPVRCSPYHRQSSRDPSRER